MAGVKCQQETRGVSTILENGKLSNPRGWPTVVVWEQGSGVGYRQTERI